MAKGKKYEAAEKHFDKKRVEYEKKIKTLTARVSEQNKIIAENQEQISTLVMENQRLNEWVERLLEYTELSKEDIKAACEKDKRMVGALSTLGMFSDILGGF